MPDVDVADAAKMVQVEARERRTAISAGKTEKTLSESAAVFFMKVEALQKERDETIRQLAEANARIEQYISSATSMRSEIESLKLKYDGERDKRIRLQECISTLERAIQQVKDVESEDV